MLGKTRAGGEKSDSEDELVGWHHRLNGHELEQTLRDSEGQASLAGCSLWGPWTARRSNQSILKEISLGVIGRTDDETQTPILWPPHVKS